MNVGPRFRRLSVADVVDEGVGDVVALSLGADVVALVPLALPALKPLALVGAGAVDWRVVPADPLAVTVAAALGAAAGLAGDDGGLLVRNSRGCGEADGGDDGEEDGGTHFEWSGHAGQHGGPLPRDVGFLLS
jgi:hypothetical protein